MIERYEELVRENKRLRAQLASFRHSHYQTQAALARSAIAGPTPEMVEAAEDAYMPFGDMELAIRMALLAAPAVQGEPVSHDWDDQDKCRRCGDRDWYASATCTPKQQPAELEILGSYPVSGQIFFREPSNEWVLELTGSVNGTRFTARHTQPADTRPEDVAGLPALYEPAPDVAGLVEALEAIQKAATHESIHTGIQAGTALGCIAAICDVALAAHRKQGGEV